MMIANQNMWNSVCYDDVNMEGPMEYTGVVVCYRRLWSHIWCIFDETLQFRLMFLLIHCDRDKMANTLQMTFSISFLNANV